MAMVVCKTAAAAHHGGLHPLLHELLDSRPDGGGGVEQHLSEEAGSDSLDLPESSPPPRRRSGGALSHLPRRSTGTAPRLLLRPPDTPSQPGRRKQDATKSPTNTSTCFRHLLS